VYPGLIVGTNVTNSQTPKKKDYNLKVIIVSGFLCNWMTTLTWVTRYHLGSCLVVWHSVSLGDWLPMFQRNCCPRDTASHPTMRSKILHSAFCCFVCIIVGGIQYNWGRSTLNGTQRDHSKMRLMWWSQEGAAKSEHQNTETSWSSDRWSMKCGLREQCLVCTVKERGLCDSVVCHFLTL